MAGKTRALAIVPARGNSKTVRQKNIRLLGGRPLIAWTIEAARKCRSIDRLIVSTDDPQIAKIARECGAEVPFLRPAELAADDTSDFPVCEHALKWLADNEQLEFDIVVWLRPTCPLRRPEDIDAVVAKMAESGADCVRSVTRVAHHPYWMKRLVGDRLEPFLEGKDEVSYYQRQLLPDLYRINGAVDAVTVGNVMANNRFLAGDMRAHVMPARFSVDIDSVEDFEIVEILMGRNKVD